MKVLLVQYYQNPMALLAVCGNSGKVYGHARYNAKLGRHEFPMELAAFQEEKTFRDLANALRRPGCQWYPLFQVPADSAAGELETLKAERDALKAEAEALAAEVAALKQELIGDEAEATGATLPDSKPVLTRDALQKRGLNYLRRLARKEGHALTSNPSKASLIDYILKAQEPQSEPAAV